MDAREFAGRSNSRAARAVPSCPLAPWRALRSPLSSPACCADGGCACACVLVCACVVGGVCVGVSLGWGACVLVCPARVRCVRCVQLHPTVSPYG